MIHVGVFKVQMRLYSSSITAGNSIDLRKLIVMDVSGTANMILVVFRYPTVMRVNDGCME